MSSRRGSKPLRSSVVKLRYYKKTNVEDKDESKHLGKLYKTLYLLSLTPDALQLSTTGDASDDASYESKAEPTSSKTSFSSLVKAPVRAIAGKSKSESAELGAQASTVSDPGQELSDNQMFTISVSLNQIISVSIEDGNCVKVIFRPNKVSRRKEKEEFTTVMKGLLFPVWFPVEAGLRENWDPEDFMANHLRKDPTAHTLLVEASDGGEAESLKAGVDEAITRLRRALEWISKDLPMLDGTSISLISLAVQPCGTQGQTQVEQTVVATHPSFGTKIALPEAVSADVALTGDGAGGGGGTGSGLCGTAVLHVWMNTPLGPAEVELVPAQQLKDAEVAAGCPFTLRAETRHGGQQRKGVDFIGQSAQKLEVLLRCSLSKGPRLPGSLSAAASRLMAPPPALRAPRSPANLVELLTRPTEGALKTLVAAMAILLILWTNVTLGSGYSFFKSGLLLFASLVVATLAVVMVMGGALMKQTPGVGAEAPAPPPPPAAEQAVDKDGSPAHFQWYLEILEADVVESAAGMGGAPPLIRTLSTTAAKAEIEAAASHQKALPPSLQRLVEQHPEIVTHNVAERFLLGWGTPSSAYAGLNDMVKWVKEQDLEGVLKRPQPYFQLAKKHYKHGCYGVSKGGLPVEIDKIGVWKHAYEIFIKAGVKESDMLHHLVFTYNYTFTYIDPRPLPHGRTVKIVDLEGLSIGDMRHDSVKFFTKVGALLNLNYPQRLHKCFLVNAPTWWAMFWKLIRPMIHKETRKQIVLFAKNDKDNMRKAILEEVDADQFPVEYGGSGTTPLYETKYEKELLRYVESLNNPHPAPAASEAAAPVAVEEPPAA